MLFLCNVAIVFSRLPFISVILKDVTVLNCIALRFSIDWLLESGLETRFFFDYLIFKACQLFLVVHEPDVLFWCILFSYKSFFNFFRVIIEQIFSAEQILFIHSVIYRIFSFKCHYISFKRSHIWNMFSSFTIFTICIFIFMYIFIYIKRKDVHTVLVIYFDSSRIFYGLIWTKSVKTYMWLE